MVRVWRIVALELALAGCEPGKVAEGQSVPKADTRTAAMRAFDAASARMHMQMGAADRDPDTAFVKGMIPHHRGAVDMAKLELRHGRDPELRALARAVVAAQESEIAAMERWLAKRGTTAKAEAAHAH